jgi:hypothetical protein
VTGRGLAKLLHNRVCRELIEGRYQSMSEATAQDPHVPMHRPSAAQVRTALAKLELASVAAVRKNGCWTVPQAAELIDVLRLTRELPGKLDTLENLAHPVGWSVIARLALAPRTREDLNFCGSSPRVTEHVKALRRSNAILDRGELITLVEPSAHLGLQDALDNIALSIAMVDAAYAHLCIRQPQLRVQVGAHYSAEPDHPIAGASRSIVMTD